jgi:anaphase-promoting complex subunit 10
MLRSDSEDEAAHASSVDAIAASADARTRAARARGGGRDDGEGARETRDDGERELNDDYDEDDDDEDDGDEDGDGGGRRLGARGAARARGGREGDGVARVAATLSDDEEDDDEEGDRGGERRGEGATTRDKKREVGHLAVWSVASAKPGNGVELLRDDDLATFWQSDGAQPHVVNAQFQHKAELCEIALWCEYKMDESYTPSLISIRAGASCHDLREVRLVELEQPNGWVRVRLRGVDDSSYLRAYFIQIAVLANHQNGRDTHVRQIKIFGPRRDQARALGRSLQLDFQSPAFSQYAGVR